MKTVAARLCAGYFAAFAITALCTLIGFPLSAHLDLSNIMMVYVLGTTLSGVGLGRGPAACNAVTNMLAFDYFFVPPTFSFDVQDTQYVFAMAVMLIVTLIVSQLTASVARHRALADLRERRTAVLYAMSRELVVASQAPAMAAAAVRHIGGVFQSQALVLIPGPDGKVASTHVLGPSCFGDALLLPRVDWDAVAEVAVRGTRVVGDLVYQPIHGSGCIEGVIAVSSPLGERPFGAEHLELLDAFAVQLALSLQRARLVEAAESARISEERARLRNTLLASISHDLRTPLAAIAGAGGLIAQPDYALHADRRMTLGRLIERKARDMSQQLSKVLELMQMEHATEGLRTDWHAVEDLVQHSLRVNEARLAHCRIETAVAPDLPPIMVEATLIVQILCNLLENAAKYTPPGTTITISAEACDDTLALVVADDGPGLPPGDPERLFEKFQRGRSEGTVVGVGLGLAICRAAARLHGGEIRAMNDPLGGARFILTLPVDRRAEEPGSIEPELVRMPA
jgi:two-component system sensor histidine kinase KdpD